MNILDCYQEEIKAAKLRELAPTMLELLKTAAKYLSHDNVAKIEFAIPSSNVVNTINELVTDVEGA